MEPLTVVCVGAGLVVGALLAWAIRGRQLSRQQQTHRQEYEAEAANHRVKIETLEVDREAVHGELGRSQQAMGETRAARSREQAAASILAPFQLHFRTFGHHFPPKIDNSSTPSPSKHFPLAS